MTLYLNVFFELPATWMVINNPKVYMVDDNDGTWAEIE